MLANDKNHWNGWYKDDAGKWHKVENNNNNNAVNDTSHAQANRSFNKKPDVVNSTKTHNVLDTIKKQNNTIHNTNENRASKPLFSKSFIGVKSKTLDRDKNANIIEVADVQQLSIIKKEIEDGKYNNFDSIVLNINGSKIAIKIKKQ